MNAKVRLVSSISHCGLCTPCFLFRSSATIRPVFRIRVGAWESVGRRLLPWPDIDLPLSQSPRASEPTFGGLLPGHESMTPNSCMQQYPKAPSIPNFFRQPPENGVAGDATLHHQKRHERSFQSCDWTGWCWTAHPTDCHLGSYGRPLGCRARIYSAVRLRKCGMGSMYVPSKRALFNRIPRFMLFTLHRSRIELGPEMLPVN